MMQIEFERELRLAYSSRFRKKNLDKNYKSFQDSGRILEEKQFMLNYCKENIEIHYTHSILSLFAWSIGLAFTLYFLLKFNVYASFIAFVLTLILHGFKNKYKSRYIIAQMARDLTESIYEGEIAEKYNF
ncbi:MAG: hypothetical protein JEZ09_15405 [Salinivirgaceae bacterium]|nr:hypothetical protein [Salinivirgaceae bacterium]